MTISEFVELMIDPSAQKIQIWDNNSDIVIWEGIADEASTDEGIEDTELLEEEITSIDPVCNNVICINIH